MLLLQYRLYGEAGNCHRFHLNVLEDLFTHLKGTVKETDRQNLVLPTWPSWLQEARLKPGAWYSI